MNSHQATNNHKIMRLTVLMALVSATAACGGGGGGDSSTSASASASASTPSASSPAVLPNASPAPGSSPAAPTPSATPTSSPTSAPTDCVFTDADVQALSTQHQTSTSTTTSGDITPIETSVLTETALSGTTFNGTAGLYEMSKTDAQTLINNGKTSPNGVGTSKKYLQITPTALVNYGSNQGGVLLTYTPAISLPRAPTLNVTYTASPTMTVKTSPTAANSASSTVNSSYTWLGTEQIAVPAGTFLACKFQTIFTAQGTTYTTTEWYVTQGTYRGFIVKNISVKTDVSGKQLSNTTAVTTAMKLGS